MQGQVVDAAGKPVDHARVSVRSNRTRGEGHPLEAVTDAAGSFSFSALPDGRYILSAEHAGQHSLPMVLATGHLQSIVLKLQPAAERAASAAPNAAPGAAADPGMVFSDKPDFTVAGVTDWTAVGGHGSDATLRTSEDLTRETLALQARGGSPLGPAAPRDEQAGEQLRLALRLAPTSYTANRDLGLYYLHQSRYREAVPLLESASAISHGQAEDEYNLALACRGEGDQKQALEHASRSLAERDTADAHRLAGELNESLGDTLAAVQQEERAVHLDPSEANYFTWGSELLLHRAVWQAAKVFRAGVASYPSSERMLTALGTALFAGALYEEAAQKLCQASDLNPADPEPYLFIGKIAFAAPAPLPCVKERLVRFVKLQPANATANYLYAMSLERQKTQADAQQIELSLNKVIALDPGYAAAYLQLGILSFARHSYTQAIEFYLEAIQANPTLSEAHYRLGMAYQHTGDTVRARQEFEVHEKLDQSETEAVDQQRREVKQFVVTLPEQAARSDN